MTKQPATPTPRVNDGTFVRFLFLALLILSALGCLLGAVA